MTIYCPHCDRRLTPDHRCVSRRMFFGLLGLGAAAAALPVGLAMKPKGIILNAGDRIGITLIATVGGLSHATVVLETLSPGNMYPQRLSAALPPGTGPFYVVPAKCKVVSLGAVVCSGQVDDLPVRMLSIARRGQ